MKVELTTYELQDLMRIQEEQAERNQRVKAGAEVVPEGTAEFPMRTLKFISEVMALSNSGQKIAAIKLVREKTRCGLKEAKDAVDGNAH